MTPLAASPPRPRQSSWIPWALIGALLVVMGANALLIHFALDSWTGLVTDRAYDEGLAFNQTLAQAKAEAAQGWNVSVRVLPTEGGAELELTVSDRAGRALTDLDAETTWIRPIGSAARVERALANRGNGHYGGSIPLPSRGQWEIRVSLAHAEGSGHIARRVVLP
ncbi:MAG: FixH family protein [Proteobacteria bacterium]|nr:FixH family protein [Pseudomonadota bacterium]